MTSSSGATTGRASFTSMRFIGLEDGVQMPLLQGEHVGLRLFTQSAPHDGAALLVHLEHLATGGLLVESEHFLEDQNHVGHQVHRVVEHDDAHTPSSASSVRTCSFGSVLE